MSARRYSVAWCLYDFANSPFPTLALTAFGAPYFTSVLVGAQGLNLGLVHLGARAAWGVAIALSMLLVTLTSPMMGVIADRSGRGLVWLSGFSVTSVCATLGLAFVPPGAGLVAFGLYVVANYAYEGAYVFYNTMLTQIAPTSRVGRLSGYGWALGYGGGLLALLVARPLMPAQYVASEADTARWVYVIVAGWFAVFGAVSLLGLRGVGGQVRPQHVPGVGFWGSLKGVGELVRQVKQTRVIWLFLIAYFLYTDALTTVIEFTGVFTKEVLHFSPKDNVNLFLVLNVIAAPGAFVFGHGIDRLGGRRTLLIAVSLWMLVVLGAIFTQTRAQFWPVVLLAAVLLGGTQASSRAWLATLAPPERTGAMMGLLSLSGKASAVVGPTVYGLLADGVGLRFGHALGHRVALGVLGLMFVAAWFVLVRIPRSAP